MPTLARLRNIKIQMFADDHAPALSETRAVTTWAEANREFLQDAWNDLRRR